jgi:hypothetical protein
MYGHDCCTLLIAVIAGLGSLVIVAAYYLKDDDV